MFKWLDSFEWSKGRIVYMTWLAMLVVFSFSLFIINKHFLNIFIAWCWMVVMTSTWPDRKDRRAQVDINVTN